MTMRVESLEEELERLDIDRHGGEVMAGTSVGHQIIEVDAAFIELFQNAQEVLILLLRRFGRSAPGDWSSAKAAFGEPNEKWPVLTKDQPYASLRAC